MQAVDQDCDETARLMRSTQAACEAHSSIPDVLLHTHRVLAIVDADLEGDQVCAVSAFLGPCRASGRKLWIHVLRMQVAMAEIDALSAQQMATVGGVPSSMAHSGSDLG